MGAITSRGGSKVCDDSHYTFMATRGAPPAVFRFPHTPLPKKRRGRPALTAGLKKKSKNMFLCCKMKNARLRVTWRTSGRSSGGLGTLSCASCRGSCGFFCYHALSYAAGGTACAGARQENSSGNGNLSRSRWVYEDSAISACPGRTPSCCWAYEKKKRRMMMTRRNCQMKSWMRRMKMKRMTCWSFGISGNLSAAPVPPLSPEPRLGMGRRSFLL